MYHHRDALDPEEHRRFAAMNDMLNPTSVGMLGLRGGERILDVGCGLAQLTRAMARSAGRSGGAMGIAHSEPWLREAERLAEASGERSLVELRHGDLTQLPLKDDEWGTFDVVHARFVLGQVERPALVVGQMAKAVRPGGRVIIEDDDHGLIRLWPEPAGYEPLRKSYLHWCESQGFNPFIGRRLVDLLHDAGVAPKRSASLSVSSCAGSPSFRPLLQIVVESFHSAGKSMMQSGAIERDTFAAGMQGLRSWDEHPAAALWYTTCWAEGRRPKS
jgi:ubiquinone/menaquinone biosynthesis C-methylase UbiE